MYWFILGRETLLSAAEIAAVLNLKKITVRDNLILETELPNKYSTTALMNKLGGTIKIARVIGANFNYDSLIAALVKQLHTQTGKIEFGVSVYNGHDSKLSESLGKAAKRIIKADGKNARYVYKREPILSSVTVAKNGLDKNGGELIVLQNKPGSYDVAVTEAVQPFEAWGERDFGRPGRDDVSGMLPPKLALMMINLAQAQGDDAILDPFCGSGTILTEAMLLGFNNLIGSDISAKAITDTQTNIDWTQNTLRSPVTNLKSSQPKAGRPLAEILNPKLFTSNITDLNQHLSQHTVNAIITEPYLGHPLTGRETREQLTEQTSELKQLYLSAFQQFKKLLSPGGTVIMIIPRFRFRHDWVTIDIKEDIKKLGFMPNPLLPGHDSLLYARANQHVGREVWRFTKIQ
jgi:tRNA G10  N-methylase Trm11